MVRLSVSLMAHESRTAWVNELLALLGDVPVAWDRIGNEWDTGSRAWQLHDPDAQWHLVLQDDALIVPDLIPRTEALLDGLDHDGPVSLYLGAGRPRQTQVRRAISRAQGGWVRLPWALWGPALVLPTHHIGDMLQGCQRGHREYDRRISHWYERRHVDTLYCLPSLVDHRDGGSLLGHHATTPRVAHHWAGHATG